MKKVYMVYKGKRAAITYNKRNAIQKAKNEGARVRVLPYRYYKDCGFTMDMPTFYAVSEELQF